MLQDAYDLGRETEHQALHAMVVESARAGKPANVNAFFILKARHGYVEADQRSSQINVAVEVQSVMVVKDSGTDAEWEAKAAAQQAKLVTDSAHTPRVAPAMGLPSTGPYLPLDYAPPSPTPSAYEGLPPAWRGNA